MTFDRANTTTTVTPLTYWAQDTSYVSAAKQEQGSATYWKPCQALKQQIKAACADCDKQHETALAMMWEIPDTATGYENLVEILAWALNERDARIDARKKAALREEKAALRVKECKKAEAIFKDETNFPALQ